MTDGILIGRQGTEGIEILEVVPGGSATLAQQVAAVVFRPGVASTGIYVATWPEVQAVIAASQGSCIVYIDDRNGACNVPGASGVTNCFGRTIIAPAYQSLPAGNVPVLTVDDGAQLLDLYKLNSFVGVLLDTRSATPALAFTTTGVAPSATFYLDEFAELAMAPTATHPGCVVSAAGFALAVDMSDGSTMSGVAGAALFDVVNTSAGLSIDATTLASPGFGAGTNTVAGNGAVTLFVEDQFSLVGGGVPGIVAPALAQVFFPNVTGTVTIINQRTQGPTDVAAVGNVTPIVVSALTDTLEVSGALTANATVQVPPQAGKLFACRNTTTGAFTVSLSTPTSAAILGPAQGKVALFMIVTGGTIVRASPDT